MTFPLLPPNYISQGFPNDCGIELFTIGWILCPKLQEDFPKVMIFLNIGEYGQTIYADLGEDVSGGSEYTFILQPEFGVKQTKTTSDGVALGTVNINAYGSNLLADQYVEYTLKDGDLDFAGLWRFKGQAQISATNLVIGDYRKITVLE